MGWDRSFCTGSSGDSSGDVRCDLLIILSLG